RSSGRPGRSSVRGVVRRQIINGNRPVRESAAESLNLSLRHGAAPTVPSGSGTQPTERRFIMRYSAILAAALSAAVLAAPAAAAPVVGVKYSDLNLATEAGQAALDARIDRAA